MPAWLVWCLAIMLGLILLWPLCQGRGLRSRAAQRRLESNWQPSYRVVPAMALLHNKSLESGGSVRAQELDRIESQIEQYKGTFAAHFWMEAAWLEGRAGRLDQARRALARARQDNPAIYAKLIRSRTWDPLRKPLGISQP